MKYSPASIGLFQAAGLAAYVSLFALAVQVTQQSALLRNLTLPPMLGIAVFLLVFIISALICGSIALLCPANLFFGGNKKEAAAVIFWTLGWLIIFLTIIAVMVGSAFATGMAAAL